jgi:hypothetical protein
MLPFDMMYDTYNVGVSREIEAGRMGKLPNF